MHSKRVIFADSYNNIVKCAGTNGRFSLNAYNIFVLYAELYKILQICFTMKKKSAMINFVFIITIVKLLEEYV